MNLNMIFGDHVKQRHKMKQEIDELLENEQTTLADIFSLSEQEKQDEIMSQLRWGNKKVLSFFNQKRILEMVEFLTVMPPDGCSHDRGHKFPFLANQIFTDGEDGVKPIVEQFFFTQVRNIPKKDSPKKVLDSSPHNPSCDLLVENVQIHQLKAPDQNSIFQSIKNMVHVLDRSEQKAEDMKKDNPDFQLVEENENEGSDDFEDLLDAADDIGTIEVFTTEDIVQEVLQDSPLNEEQQVLRPDVELMLDKFNDPKNVKKSFEVKIENDDDDEIFIVHDEGDENDVQQDQDNLFISASSNVEVKTKISDSNPLFLDLLKVGDQGEVRKPFKDNLANSERLPETNKLIDVEINEDYMNQMSSSQHKENIQKRKNNRGKSISIHQFDEATQKSIQDTVEKERVNIENKEGESLKLSNVVVVEDHITSGKKIDQEDEINQKQSESDEKDPMKIVVKTQKTEDEDNILRKSDENQTTEVGCQKSPESPNSPDQDQLDNFTAQYSAEPDDQVSVEFERVDQFTKEQDYSLISQLFLFLDSPPESEDPTKGLNSTLCGYFGKVVQIVISFEPIEFLKFIQQDDYAILSKMVNHLDNKSISEILIKILNEILKRSGDNLILSQGGVTTLAQSTTENLQQSGQSGQSNERQSKTETPQLKKLQQIMVQILQEKFNDTADMLQMMGASEVINEMLKNKLCYQILTRKKPFEIITANLISDNEAVQMHMYVILTNLISYFDKYEKFEKRIVIDNFEDEEIINENSGSGSFMNANKSRNSRKNQDLMRDMQDSDLFKFVNVVISEFIQDEMDKKYNKIVKALTQGIDDRLGALFQVIMEFLEKASSTFSGFPRDINQSIVDSKFFENIFDILEYFNCSDILNLKVFKIIDNILKDKNEDVQEIIQVLFSKSEFIQFLIKNGPQVQEESPVKPLEENSAASTIIGKEAELSAKDISSPTRKTEEKKEGNTSKSPEQSSRRQDDSEVKQSKEETKVKKITIPSVKNQSGLQAHVKIMTQSIIEYQKKDKHNELQLNLKKYLGGQDTSQQSGEQSKSSIINETENEDEMREQKVCRIISMELNNHPEWQPFIYNQIEPLIELEKGKLCQDDKNDSGSTNFDGNIFDDEFLKNDDFANNPNDDKDDNMFGIKVDKEEEDDDNHKFFKKIQQCFSSNNGRARRNSEDLVDVNERQMKQEAYSDPQNELNKDLRASLSDMIGDKNDSPFQQRDRSTSNENFNLPPLSSLDDNKDLCNDMNLDTDNYKSNENTFGSNLSVFLNTNIDLQGQIGHLPEIKSATDLALDLDIPDVDIDLNDDSPKSKDKNEPLQTESSADAILFSDDQAFIIHTVDDDNQEPEFNFFREDKQIAPKIVEKEENEGKIVFENHLIEPINAIRQQDEDLKNIFDQIDQLNSDDENEEGEDTQEKKDDLTQSLQSSQNLEIKDIDEELNIAVYKKNILSKSEYPQASNTIFVKHTEGIQQTLDEIQNDFPGISINNNLTQDLAKSQFIPENPKLLEVEEKPEFYDNNFWSQYPLASLGQSENIDDLLKDYDQ